MPRHKNVIPTVDKSKPKPGERIAHPELVRECREDGKGWRRDAYGNWWPCDVNIGPLLTREEFREQQTADAQSGNEREAQGEV